MARFSFGASSGRDHFGGQAGGHQRGELGIRHIDLSAIH